MSVRPDEKLLEQLCKIASARVLDSLQQKAWQLFVEKGFPAKTEEAFQYLGFRQLHEQRFSQESVAGKEVSLSATQQYRFVFIDGKFSLSKSSLQHLPEGVVFMPLQEAMHTYGPLLKARAAKVFEEKTTSSLLVLNYALSQEGFFLYIPPNISLDKEVEIVEMYTSTEPTMYFPRVSIYLGKNSRASFRMQTKAFSSHLINRSLEISLDKGSFCVVEDPLLDIEDVFYFNQVHIDLKAGAVGKYLSCDTGSKLCRQDFTVQLLEEGSAITIQGLSIVQDSAQSHHHVRVHHLAPRCVSSQHFKGVLLDRSTLSFEGKIKVASVAQQTEAYQLCNHLLMNPSARAYSKPNLEIFADDVKASHGATVVQLRPEEMFYLQARGLDVVQAKRLLVKGFCRELLCKMDPKVQEQMLQRWRGYDS